MNKCNFYVLLAERKTPSALSWRFRHVPNMYLKAQHVRTETQGIRWLQTGLFSFVTLKIKCDQMYGYVSLIQAVSRARNKLATWANSSSSSWKVFPVFLVKKSVSIRARTVLLPSSHLRRKHVTWSIAAFSLLLNITETDTSQNNGYIITKIYLVSKYIVTIILH